MSYSGNKVGLELDSHCSDDSHCQYFPEKQSWCRNEQVCQGGHVYVRLYCTLDNYYDKHKNNCLQA